MIVKVTEDRTLDLERRFANDLTPQEVADIATYHLGTMPMRAATSAGQCQYRLDRTGFGGTKMTCRCAVGYFIHDSEYDQAMEGIPLETLLAYYPKLQRLRDHMMMLYHFQTIHDRASSWEDGRQSMTHFILNVYMKYELDGRIIQHPDMAWNKSA